MRVTNYQALWPDIIFACRKEPKDLAAAIINDTDVITIKRKRNLASKYQLHAAKSFSKKFWARPLLDAWFGLSTNHCCQLFRNSFWTFVFNNKVACRGITVVPAEPNILNEKYNAV